MDEAAGRPLDWFWREWFLETPRFDQTIEGVTQTTAGATTHVTVQYGNKGRGVLPLLVRFTFRDGTTQDVAYPADVWRANSSHYIVASIFKHPVVKIVIDPDQHLIDADRSNNSWVSP